MAEDDDKQQDEGTKKAKKGGGKGGKIVLIVVLLVFVAAAFVGGIFLAPKVAPSLGAQPQPVKSIVVVQDTLPVLQTKALDAVIIDVRSAAGEVHHLKVSITIEFNDTYKGEDFDKYLPRVRSAIISFFRKQTYERVSSPTDFDAIRDELTEVLMKEVGRSRMERILFTEYVIQ